MLTGTRPCPKRGLVSFQPPPRGLLQFRRIALCSDYAVVDRVVALQRAFGRTPV
jgi:hypothetical protein